MQNELLNDCNVNQSIWKYIDKIGVGDCKSNKIQMDVLRNDGFTVSSIK